MKNIIVDEGIKRLHEQVLYTQVRVRTAKAGGSGTVIYSGESKEGYNTYVITCHHVIEGALSVKKEYDPKIGQDRKVEYRQVIGVEFFDYISVPHGRRPVSNNVDADIVAYDKTHDMALLKLRKISESEYVAKLLPENLISEVCVGDKSYAVGCALLHDPILTEGMITHMGDEIDYNDYWMCHSADTEVLSKHGWKTIAGTVEGEEIMCWNQLTNELVFQPIQQKYIYDYNGDLLEIDSKQANCLITPNHKLQYRNDSREIWRLSQISDITAKHFQVKVMAPYNKEKEMKVSDDFLRLLGWIITEGNFYKRSENVRVTQSITANPQNVKKIEKLLQNLNINASHYTLERGRRTWIIPSSDSIEIRGLIPEKKLTRQILEECSTRQLNILFETMIEGDGTFRNGKPYRFYTKDYEDASLFQELAVKLGYRTSLNWMPSWTVWHVYLSKQHESYVTDIEAIPYKGKVYGLEVPSKYTLTRRNGKCIITHNSSAQIIFGNSGGAMFRPTKNKYFFIGVPSRIDVAGWSDPITHLGYFSPISRVYDFLRDENFQFIFDDSYTEEQCEKKRKEIKNQAMQRRYIPAEDEKTEETKVEEPEKDEE